jgi:hypothetical protein
VGQSRIIEASRSHSGTLHSSGLLWKSDQPVKVTSTWQRTTLTTDRHPCRLRDSNPQSKQASERPQTNHSATGISYTFYTDIKFKEHENDYPSYWVDTLSLIFIYETEGFCRFSSNILMCWNATCWQHCVSETGAHATWLYFYCLIVHTGLVKIVLTQIVENQLFTKHTYVQDDLQDGLKLFASCLTHNNQRTTVPFNLSPMAYVYLQEKNNPLVLIVVFPCMLIIIQLLFQQNAHVFYY